MNGVLKWVATALVGGSVQCGVAVELPVESFFRDYEYNSVALSPNGDYLAALAPVKARVGLVVVDLKNRAAKCAYADKSADIFWFEWANNDRLICQFTKDAYQLGGLMSVGRDGSSPCLPVRMDNFGTGFLATLPGSPDEILVTSLLYPGPGFGSGWRYPHVDRMNIFSGRKTREVTNPGRVFGWLTDHNAVVRVGVGFEKEDQFKVIYRAGTNAAWQTIAQFRYNEDGIDPLGFDYDNQTLFVGHCGDRDTAGVYKFDVTAKQIRELGFRHAEADVTHVCFSDKERVLAGVRYHRERPETFWFNQKYQRMQASVDRALPETFNLLTSLSEDETKAVIFAYSDRAPGTFYLLNQITMKMEKLFDTAAWLDPEQMAETKPIQYPARDGLTIHGYLTLPKGSRGRNVPLIVNPHGGPAARDVWGFDPEVQFFANRGYAVLRMNFRGSTGYGKTFREAGHRQWGLKQQDDITDGVKWAIAQGIADPTRIGIYGASYGGFAALTGLEQTPELYRCGICCAGVTDIAGYLEFVLRRNRNLEFARALAAETVGDPKKESERLRELSPLSHADRIQVPVLLAYGKLDPRVRVSNGREMARALKKRGRLYEYIEKKDEGHGFLKQENKIELWKKIDAFLKANMR